MTPAALLQRMAADGLNVAVTARREIKVTGPQDAVARWKPELVARKAAIVAALSEPPPDIQDFLDAVEERAAILQHDAPDCYPTREAATATAYEECKAKWRKA